MNFCSACGSVVSLRVPSGDDRHRHICDYCDTVHYQNPCIITGCVPVYGERILLCKRAIAPRRGYWTLPAGFMENGETTAEGAVRECREEANAQVVNTELYAMIDIPHINQVYMFFRGELAVPEFSPGVESLAVDLFREEDIPWDEIAFPSVHKTLRYFFQDRKLGEFRVRTDTVRRG
ncbi:MAG TPA: NUDIX hydrolase [Porticoccaceae bacterium]|nr:NUDIX hydrolase [Porticoccaceae bacterium]